jgi:hypothetical protein
LILSGVSDKPFKVEIRVTETMDTKQQVFFFYASVFIKKGFIRSKPSWRIEVKRKQPCEPQSYSSDRAYPLVRE